MKRSLLSGSCGVDAYFFQYMIYVSLLNKGLLLHAPYTWHRSGEAKTNPGTGTLSTVSVCEVIFDIAH